MDEDSEPCSRPAGRRSRRGEVAGAMLGRWLISDVEHEIACGNTLRRGRKKKSYESSDSDQGEEKAGESC